jgi:hypothetical protein
MVKSYTTIHTSDIITQGTGPIPIENAATYIWLITKKDETISGQIGIYYV